MAEEYSMVEECTDSYRVSELENGDTQIVMRIPPRFRTLWLVKLTDLTTTDEEIARYEGS